LAVLDGEVERQMTVQITRLDCDAAALRQQAARVAEAAVARRLLALALVLEMGWTAPAASVCHSVGRDDPQKGNRLQ
jgi:hypothetical protein